MISGVHVIIFSREADAVRAFLRDVLEFPSVDAGEGWPIFALPPAELAAHPTDDAGHHELYLMCDDIEAAVGELERKGVQISGQISEERWGRLAAIRMPDRQRTPSLPAESPNSAARPIVARSGAGSSVVKPAELGTCSPRLASGRRVAA